MLTTRQASPSAQSESRAGRLPAVDVLTLGAVLVVVLLVSLPCLRDFAVRENERDAQALLPVLVELLNGGPGNGEPLQGEPGAEQRQPDLAGLVAATPALADELRDAHPGEHGASLRHHGYLFSAGAPGPGGERAVLAWPLDRGRTGLRAFACRPGGGLGLHAYLDGRWCGPRGPERLSAAEGWAPAR
jgi:hypothetical protein